MADDYKGMGQRKGKEIQLFFNGDPEKEAGSKVRARSHSLNLI